MTSFKKSHFEKPNPIAVALLSDPWGMMLATYFTLLGVYTMVGIGTHALPNSRLLDDTLSTFGMINWAVALMVGGPMMTVGRVLQKFRLEASGLGFIVYASLTYMGVVFYNSGLSGIVAAGAYATISTAALIRLWVLRKDREARAVAGQIIVERRRNGDSDPQ